MASMGLLCGQGQRSTWPKPGAFHQTPLPLPFLGLLRLSTAPALPPSEESLPGFNQSLACPHPFQKNQPQELPWPWALPSACPPESGFH